MKTKILCYGDSLTWGYIPATDHERHPKGIRWTSLLQKSLGSDYEVIEEGLNSRTVYSEDPRPNKERRNGLKTFLPTLEQHKPVDILILFLGTNQLKDVFDSPIKEISKYIEEVYIKKVSPNTKILLISPPEIDISKEYAKARFGNIGNKIELISKEYSEIAKKNSCLFIDSSKLIKPGEDGIHLDIENNEILASEIFKILKRII